jgi:hypothetical protein
MERLPGSANFSPLEKNLCSPVSETVPTWLFSAAMTWFAAACGDLRLRTFQKVADIQWVA